MHRQGRLEEAKTEATRTLEIYQKLGASGDVEGCSAVIRDIQGELGRHQ